MLSDGTWSVGFAGGVEMAESNVEVRGFKKTEREKKRELRLSLLIGGLWEWWAGLRDALRFRFGDVSCHSCE